MRGKTVGCLKESFAERLLHDAGGIEVKGYEGVIEPYIDLRHHHLDAVVMDAPIALYYGRGPELDSTPADFGEARYGIAAKPGQKLLIEAIDGAIDELAKSGELARICERYGVWNQPTAELFGLKYEAATGEAPMLAEFNRKANGWHDRLANYRDSLPLFAVGAVMTLALSIVGMAIAILLGLALALTRLYAPAPLRTLAVIYIEGIRGTPLLIQLYIIFYALPDLLHVDLPAFFAAVIGLGLNYAAYEAENYRAGLTSIALGQTEAAHALGLTHMQTLRYVIVPQALRIVIPPVTNDFIALLKDSSIVSVIAMTELTETYTSLSSSTGDRVGMGLVAAAFYFVLGWPFAKLAAKLEERARRGRR
jgi:polar amino acid transport system substrate-binding protein